MTKNLFLGFANFLGAIVIILLHLRFKDYLGEDIFWVSIIFALLAYGVSTFPFFGRLIPLGDKYHSWVGSLGLSIFSNSIYCCGTFVAIVLMNIVTPHVELLFQIIVHLLLLSFLFMGWHFRDVSFRKAHEVAQQEEKLLSRSNYVKSRLEELNYLVKSNQNLSANIYDRVEQLTNSCRYMSPLNSREAFSLEEEILRKIDHITTILKTDKSEQMIESLLATTELLLERRKKMRN